MAEVTWAKRAWNGEEKLWKIFWIYGVFLGVVLLVPLLPICFFLLPFLLAGRVGIFLIALLVLIVWLIIDLIYGIWFCRSLWKCAFNTRNKLWGYVTRGGVILWVISFPLFPFFKSPVVFSNSSQYTNIINEQNEVTGNLEESTRICKNKMVEYAKSTGVDAQKYISENRAYLNQCRQAYLKQVREDKARKNNFSVSAPNQ